MKLSTLFYQAGFRLLFSTVVTGALFQANLAIAQSVQWKIVPGTSGVSAMHPQGSDPVLIGTNTIVSRGDTLTFDAVIDAQYVRYNGNCRTRQLFILRRGKLNAGLQPSNVEKNQIEAWFMASEFQEKFLTEACALRVNRDRN